MKTAPNWCARSAPTSGLPAAPPKWQSDDAVKIIKDSVGNVLQDGDTITVIKDLKVKGYVAGGQGRHQGQEHPPVSMATTTSTARSTASAR
jgi:hypothetical protein